MSQPEGATRIALVSGCDRIRYASYVGHQLYARRHELASHHELAPFEGARHYWHKIAAISRHLAAYDWVVWLDDDAFITDLESDFIRRNLSAAEREDHWLVIAPSVADELNGAWAAYNTGVIALRNRPESHDLLTALPQVPLDRLEAAWDTERLGVFTHGDQDALAWHLETRGLQAGVHWVDPLDWNARPWSYGAQPVDPPVCHFPGQPDKTLAIHQLARRLGTDQTLVLPAHAGRRRLDLHAQVADIGAVDAAARQVSVHGTRLARRARRKVAWIRETGRWR